MKNLLTIVCCMLLCSIVTTAQSIGPSILNTTGGSNVIGGNTYEYVIGDVVAGSTYSGPGLIVTQGVLQPKVNDPDGISTPAISAQDLSVFPNPVEQTLFLQPDFGKKGVLEYVLTDINGRVMAKHKVNLDLGNERQEITMTHLAAGQYSLSVLWTQQGHDYRSAYKIQKVK